MSRSWLSVTLAALALALSAFGIVEAGSREGAKLGDGGQSPQGPAEVAVGNLRLLESPDETGHHNWFAPGTKVVYATFEYSGADNHQIGLNVTGRGALTLYQHSDRYHGDGSETVALRGTDLTKAIASELELSAQAARDDTRTAAAQPFGVQEYLLSAQGGLLRVGYALDLLEGARLGEVSEALFEEIRAEASAASEKVREAIRVPMSEVERKREAARAADDSLSVTAALSGELSRLIATMSDLPIPETPPTQHYAYAVQLHVRGLPVAVKEFLVSESVPIFLPYCVRP